MKYMKTAVKTSVWALLLMGLFIFNSCKSGGEQVVDEMCDTIEKVTKELDKCKDFQDIQNSNYKKILEDSKLDAKIKENQDYVLSASDKEKLKKTFNNFIKIFMTKIVGLSGGMVEESAIEENTKLVEQQIDEQIQSSKTLGDFYKNMGL